MNGASTLGLGTASWWMAYDLGPDGTAAVVRQVDAHIARHPELSHRRRVLADLLTSRSAGARAEGARVGALRYEEHPAYGGLVASMTGWLLDRDPGRAGAPAAPDDGADFSSAGGADRHAPRVSRVHLPYGPGTRVEVTRWAPTADEPGLEPCLVVHTVEYRVPLEAPADTVLFVRFVASDPAGASRLAGEFLTVMARLQLPAPP